MTDKTVTPSLGAKSFTCPHCGAFAHQTWFKIFRDDFEKDQYPWVPDQEMIDNVRSNRDLPGKEGLLKFLERRAARGLFFENHENFVYVKGELVNLYLSFCYSCAGISVWVADNLLYPSQPTSIQPNDEMPKEIRPDFLEAAAIVDRSSRGAAALLRLCIQKLMVHLGEKGKNIDDDIGALVNRGLDGRIQKALDIVRVIGNNAVHPGQIDLRDDKATATELFKLVNLIVEAMIATPKHIEAMYGALPEGARKAIEKRDAEKP
jgi:Domain of unknown function (DUF4145)